MNRSSEFFQFPAARGDRVAPEDAPRAIVDNGLIRLGLFKTPVREMKLRTSALLKGFGASWPTPPLLVEWVGAGMAHPDWYLGVIVVDASKLFSLSVVYGYNRKTGAYFSHDGIARRSRVRVADATWNDVTRFEGRGFHVEFVHRLDQGFHRVNIDIRAAGKKPAVRGNLIWHEELGKSQPLVLLSPVEGGGFIYNHKAQMPIEGDLRIGTQDLKFDPRRDVANLDEVKVHGGALRLSYRWFNFGGFDRQGRLVGLDLAHSPQKPDPYWTENCMWVGDKLWMLGHVQFEMNRRDLMQPWRARDKEGRVDISFFPEGGKAVNLGPLGKYYQKCGSFRGKLIDGEGVEHLIEDIYGCAESMDVLG
jgi:hypothetical protein